MRDPRVQGFPSVPRGRFHPNNRKGKGCFVWTAGVAQSIRVDMKKDAWLYAMALVVGIAVWVVVSQVSQRREAWDSQWYFIVGVPVMCVVSAMLGFVEPNRPWRWGAAPLAGQFVWMLVTPGPGNLLPLGIVVFGILAIPSMLTARLGAVAGKMRSGA